MNRGFTTQVHSITWAWFSAKRSLMIYATCKAERTNNQADAGIGK